jgi:hypothetical protein
MVTRGLGYETASTPLTYPYGYISAAQDNGILDDVTIVPTEPALRGMDAVIIYNAIFAEYPKMATYQYINGVYSQKIPTVADYVYHIEQLGNTDDIDDQTWVVVGADEYTENTIKLQKINKDEKNSNRYASIDAVAYFDTSLTKSQIDSAKYYESRVYYNYDDGKVVAIEVLDSQKSYTVTPATYENNSNDSEKSDNKIVVNSMTLDLTLATNIKDELYTKNDGGTAYEKANFDTRTGNVYTLYDWNGDRYIDYVDVDTRYYAYVAALSGDKISFVLDGRVKGETTLPATEKDEWLKTTIDMADADEHYTWNLEDGVEQGSIVEIDISRVYSDDDKGAHATYTVSLVNALEDVTFTSVKNGDSESDGKWYFDDVQYKLSKYDLFDLADDDNESDFTDGYEDNLGEAYTVYLDRNGFILYATSADAIIGDYMVILETNDDGNTALKTPKAYALLDTETYKTLAVDSETDSEPNLYDDTVGFITPKNTASSGMSGNALLSLVAYKLDGDGNICDWNNVGNAADGTYISYDKDSNVYNKQSYRNNVGGKVTGFDDDTNKITIGNSRYEISDEAKIFVIAKTFYDSKTKTYYAYDGTGTGATASDPKAYSTSNWKDYTKVVSASELSDSYKYDQHDVYGVGAMFSQSNNTLKALALVGDEDFFNSSSGDKYPAVINSVTQSLASSSSSKFVYTISAYMNGEKQSLKTEAVTSSYFNGTLAADFGNAQNCADRLAWITVNNAGEVTKIEAVDIQAGVPVTNPTTESATRGIVTSKNSKGLTYITLGNVEYLDGNAAVINGNKADKTDYQAYASDAAFYIVDNRAANLLETSTTGVYNSDKLDKNPEEDYEVSVGTSSNLMTSVINGKDTDIYYIADIFFNDDGDIQAVVFYSTSATCVSSLPKVSFTAPAGVTFTNNVANVAKDSGDVVITVEAGASVKDANGDTVALTNNTFTVSTATAGDYTYTISKSGVASQTITVKVGAGASLNATFTVGGEAVENGAQIESGSALKITATAASGLTVDAGSSVNAVTASNVNGSDVTLTNLGDMSITLSAPGYDDATISFTVVKKTLNATVSNANGELTAREDGSYVVKTTDTVTVKLTDSADADVTTASVDVDEAGSPTAVGSATYTATVGTAGDIKLDFTASGYEDVSIVLHSYNPTLAAAELVKGGTAVTNAETEIAFGDVITARLKSDFTASTYTDPDFVVKAAGESDYTELATWKMPTSALDGTGKAVTLHDNNGYYDDFEIAATAMVVQAARTAVITANAGETTVTVTLNSLNDLNDTGLASLITVTAQGDGFNTPPTVTATYNASKSTVTGNTLKIVYDLTSSAGGAYTLATGDEVTAAEIAATTNYKAVTADAVTIE